MLGLFVFISHKYTIEDIFMAVYQISRIQIRRGQANAGTGLPQLASGEMAWAIDTQQLYIGSGAVSEGAPAVSNIKVITEKDLGLEGSLLGLVQYVYGSSNAAVITGPNANSPVGRAISLRLDDQINTADFGTIGNGTTDDTSAIQRAINQLFLNPSNPANLTTATSSRVILSLPAGKYYTSSTIYIPSYASLVGSGIDKTIIDYHPTQVSITGSITISNPILATTSATASMLHYLVTGTGIPANTYVSNVVVGVSLTLSNSATATLATQPFTITDSSPAFQFVNDSSSIDNPDPVVAQSTTQPRKIHMSDMTIQTSTGLNTGLQLNSVRDSLFENISLIGGWSGSTNSYSVGIGMTAVSSLVTCEHNIFKNVVINSFNYGVFAQLDILNNSFSSCFISNCLQGVTLGLGGATTLANPYGPRQTEIINTKFYNIKQQAVYVDTGSSTVVRDCKYVNVGNNGNNNTASQYSQVYFNSYGNATYNDQSDRHSDLSDPNTSSNATFALIPYVPEVSGHSVYTFNSTSTIGIVQSATYVQILKLPVSWLPTPADRTTGPTGQITYTINYLYTSLSNTFTRSGTITITADITNTQIQLNDEYNFAGVDAGDTNATYLDFKAQFLDVNGSLTGGAPWTIVLSYVNNLSGDTGVLSYTYTSIC